MLGSVGAGLYGVFLADYNLPTHPNEEHIFSGIQRNQRHLVNQYVLGIPDADVPAKNESQESQNSGKQQ